MLETKESKKQSDLMKAKIIDGEDVYNKALTIYNFLVAAPVQGVTLSDDIPLRAVLRGGIDKNKVDINFEDRLIFSFRSFAGSSRVSMNQSEKSPYKLEIYAHDQLIDRGDDFLEYLKKLVEAKIAATLMEEEQTQLRLKNFIAHFGQE